MLIAPQSRGSSRHMRNSYAIHGVMPSGDCNCDFNCEVSKKVFGKTIRWNDPTCLARKADCRSNGAICRTACDVAAQAGRAACAASGAGLVCELGVDAAQQECRNNRCCNG